MQIITHCTKQTVRCETNPYSLHFKYLSAGKNTPICCASHLCEILFFVTDLLEQHDIPYFLTWGTQLGAIRHGGLIPWDTDADIGILKKDYSRVKALRPLLIQQGFWFANFGFEGEGLTIFYSKINHLHLDIEIWQEEGDHLTWSKFKVHKKDIFPLKRYKFYDSYLWGSHNINYLLDFYGANCLTHGHKQCGDFYSDHDFLLTDFYSAPIDLQQDFTQLVELNLYLRIQQQLIAYSHRVKRIIVIKFLAKIVHLGQSILPVSLRIFLWRTVGNKLFKSLEP